MVCYHRKFIFCFCQFFYRGSRRIFWRTLAYLANDWIKCLAVLTKLAGAALGAKFARFSWNGLLSVVAGMVSRGEAALIIAGIGLKTKLLSPDLFTVFV